MASLKQKLLEVDFTPVHLSTRLGKEKQGMCISLSWVSQIVAKSKIACLDLLDINGTSGCAAFISCAILSRMLNIDIFV